MNIARLDQEIDLLQSQKRVWARLPLSQRLEHLRSCLEGTGRVAERQVQAALRAKGLKARDPRAGEEWLAGPAVQARSIRLLIKSLEEIEAKGCLQIDPRRVQSRDDGQVVVQVFPNDLYDRVLFRGFQAEVWMQPEVRAEALEEQMAAFYREEEPEGTVALVLGAGNVASIGPLDVIHKLFAEGQVCLLKFNPVNAYLGPLLEEAFQDLIQAGFLRTAYGGAEVGQYLCRHQGIEEIHITGSAKTHDTILFGGGDLGAKRKEQGEPLLKKRITSELGNVSPVIILPGLWSQADLRFQAENVATQMCNNGGFNCNAAQLLILHESWPQRQEFMEQLRTLLAALPQRPAYYPGAEMRYQRFVSRHPQAEPLGPPPDKGVLPWTLIPDVDAQAEEEICFSQESFCGILAQTTLPGADPQEFLKAAVQFCNRKLWGSLSACLILHPKSEAALGPALDEAISALHYGCIAINHWPALGYGLGVTPWGAFPGHSPQDIQSGSGTVHNSLLFDKPQKAVIRGPFRVWPKPPWFLNHRQGHRVGVQLLKLELKPSLPKLPKLLLHALRG